MDAQYISFLGTPVLDNNCTHALRYETVNIKGLEDKFF